MVTFLQLALLSINLKQAPVVVTSTATVTRVQVATYVPVCKNRRGIFDRRACGGRSDPRRTLVA